MSLQNPIHSEMYKHPNNSIAHSPAHQGGYLHLYQPSNNTPPDAKKKATFFKAYQGTTFHHDYFADKEQQAIVDYSPIASPKTNAATALNANDDEFVDPQQDAQQQQDENAEEKQPITPLPKKRMFMISLVIMADAFGYSLMTPFLPFMIKEMKVAKTEQQIGYFVGILVSAVSFAQLISGVTWGKISDRYGRRPVLLIGMLANFVCLALFGFSKNFWVALATRVVDGALNGIMPAYKSYIYDSTDETNQERGFIIVGVVWAVASICAPAVGGWLAPAKKFSFLKNVQIFVDFPYLLAVLVPVIINIVVFLISVFFLEESKSFTKKRVARATTVDDATNEEETTSTAPQEESIEKEQAVDASALPTQEEEEQQPTTDQQYYNKPSLWRRIKSAWFLDPTVIKVLILYGLISFILSMFDELFPLWASSKSAIGGLAWDSTLIGIVLSVAGVTSLATLLFYPILVARLGVLRTYQLACLVLLGVGIIFPFNSDLSRLVPQPVVWITVALGVLLRTCCGEICYTSQYILVSNSVSPELNGAMNGLASTIGSIGWAFGPLFGGSVYAASLGWFPDSSYEGWLNYVPFEKVVFACMTIFSMVTLIVSLCMPKSIQQRKYGEEEEKLVDEMATADASEQPLAYQE